MLVQKTWSDSYLLKKCVWATLCPFLSYLEGITFNNATMDLLAKSKVQQTIASLLDAVDTHQKLAIELTLSLKKSLIVNVLKYIVVRLVFA